MIKVIWLDGCVYGIVSSMKLSGTPRHEIPIMAILDHCSKEAEPRISGDLHI